MASRYHGSLASQAVPVVKKSRSHLRPSLPRYRENEELGPCALEGEAGGTCAILAVLERPEVECPSQIQFHPNLIARLRRHSKTPSLNFSIYPLVWVQSTLGTAA